MTLYTKEAISFDEKSYISFWDELEEKMIQSGFTWAALYENEEWNQYMTPSLFELKEEEWNNLMQDTLNISKIVQKGFEHIQNNPSILAELKIPEVFHPLMTIKQNTFSYFTRMDLVLRDNMVKVLEFNADTPVGMVEPSVGNDVICSSYGKKNPNFLNEQAKETWEQVIRDYQISSEETIYFTSYAWHDEDTKTVQWMMNQCPHTHKKFVDFESLIVNSNGVFTKGGKKIQFLYRLYPLEFLLEESFGIQMIEHLKNGNVSFINPPSSFIVQSKMFMAWIWKSHEELSPIFNEKEHEYIERYFLPTYTTNEPFICDNGSYVSKPIFGREGGGIEIFIDHKEDTKDDTPYYSNQTKIYQKYLELPDMSVTTWDGPYTGKLLIGSHFFGGKPCGIFPRVGEKITGNLSMFCGISVLTE